MKGVTIVAALAGMTLLAFGGAAKAADPWPVKVVIVTTFEVGKDTGDKPGELQLWAEREDLTEHVDFPGGVHPLLTNRDHSVVALLTGMGLVNSGASVMALAADPRFNTKKAYWLVAAIAGVDPAVGSIGDAAWADYVINDQAHAMDMREAPAGWPYGVFAFNSKGPGQMPDEVATYGPFDRYAEVFPMNPGLVRWAYRLTKDVKLDYTSEEAASAKDWTDYPKAGQPPKVFIGASSSSNYYWHGRAHTEWARDWVKMFTSGKSTFAMANTEDASIAEAMARLDRMGLADYSRLMVLRTGSNYTIPRKGLSTFQSMTTPYPGSGAPAFEAAYRVGSKVVHELTAHWSQYADAPPSAP
jgi:purine nucleoside permease